MNRDIALDPIEARVFGVLIEKALTTPEQYPLSVNAATNGANQKVNRDPVLALSEDEVAGALQRLERQYLARTVFPANSRVEKFCHNGKDALGLDAVRLAIVAELLLRGPETSGELRARAGRMQPIESLEHLETLLVPLITEGYVARLAPAPGSRAERYVQLLSPDLHKLDAAPAAPASSTPAAGGLSTRVDTLEAEVERLQRRLQALATKLGVPLDDEAAERT